MTTKPPHTIQELLALDEYRLTSSEIISENYRLRPIIEAQEARIKALRKALEFYGFGLAAWRMNTGETEKGKQARIALAADDTAEGEILKGSAE